MSIRGLHHDQTSTMTAFRVLSPETDSKVIYLGRWREAPTGGGSILRVNGWLFPV